MVRTEHTKTIIKNIQWLGQRHSNWQAFVDFVSMAALSISNSVDWIHRDEREKQYLEIVKRYTKEEVDLFPQMFASLIEELERHAEAPQDVLGPIYHELELHNKWKGQFFTPQHICDFMGLVALGENDPDIEKRGYLTVCEPCAGSGAMVLGFAKAMRQNHYDFQRQMVVTATDIDLKCVFMTYLQLSLYGIPAVVIHGNTLTMEEWSRWYTPVYMLNGWVWRQTCGNRGGRYAEDEIIKRAQQPAYGFIRDMEANSRKDTKAELMDEVKLKEDSPESDYDVTLKEGKNGQMQLF